MSENIENSVLVRMGGEISVPVKRIVSLVPSLTESVFYLDAGDKLAGRTDFCFRPEGKVDEIAKVGGPKEVDVERAKKLKPDLILASREENDKEQVMALAAQFPVLLVDPKSPADAPLIWRAMGKLLGAENKAEIQAREVERELKAATARAAEEPGQGMSFIYYVWKDPWIVAGHDTYISRMLELAGFRNALPEDQTRFPQVISEDVNKAGADIHLYCSEPWAFNLPDELFGGQSAKAVKLDENWFKIDSTLAAYVDAEAISWYPSRAAEGLRYLARIKDKAQMFKQQYVL